MSLNRAIAGLMSNGVASAAKLAEINQLLRKSADIGYQTAPGMGSGELAPLVAQSIEGMLSSATFDETVLTLWQRIPKTSASQTLHEYAVVKQHGIDLDPFVAEGSAGANNRTTRERESIRIKFLLERREVTDVAQAVGLIGVDRDALTVETKEGMLSLLEKTERSLWHAEEANNPLAFDGIIPQIVAHTNDDGSKNVTNLAGGAVTFDRLEDTLGHLGSAPLYGRPDTIYVEPRVYRDLSRQANPAGRFSLTDGNRKLEYGVPVGGMCVNGPYGPVPIIPAPLLWRNQSAPSTASSTDNAPATPIITQQPTNNGTGTSEWSTAEAGTYYYKIVAVGPKGYSAPVTTNAVIVAATNKIKTIISNANTGVSYYRVYRTDKNGLTPTAKHIMDVPAVTGVATDIIDLAAVKASSSHVVFVQHDPRIFAFARLLDLIRRPLAEVETSKPFGLVMMGSPVVKVPSKCWVYQNCGTKSVLT